MGSTFFDDSAMAPALNEQPALGQVMQRIVAALNNFSARPRPIANRIGGNDNSAEANTEPQIRLLYYPTSVGAPALLGRALTVPIANAASVPLTGLTLKYSENGNATSELITQQRGAKEDQSADPEIWYPQYARTETLFAGHFSDYTGSPPPTAREVIVQTGESGVSRGPQLRATLIMERMIQNEILTLLATSTPHPIVGIESMPVDHLSSGLEILGNGVNHRDLKSVRDFAERLAQEKGIQFSWNMAPNTGSGTQGESFTSQRRYILNANYGADSGIAPTVTGPGIRLPLRYMARGRQTTVRVYVRAYARTTGAGVGYGWTFNRNNSGGMAGPTALVNAPSMSGSTWRWWPNGAFDPVNDPYFLGNANPAYPTDVILPCFSNASGNVEVSAFTMRVFPTAS